MHGARGPGPRHPAGLQPLQVGHLLPEEEDALLLQGRLDLGEPDQGARHLQVCGHLQHKVENMHRSNYDLITHHTRTSHFIHLMPKFTHFTHASNPRRPIIFNHKLHGSIFCNILHFCAENFMVRAKLSTQWFTEDRIVLL